MSTEKDPRVFFVRVDENGKWTPTKYRKVGVEELDDILNSYKAELRRICGCGKRGAMTMWAYFRNRIDGGCYSDLINSYELLGEDSKSLVDREHEFRHMFMQFEELWQIRYYSTVEEYYLKKAEEAKDKLNNYLKENGGL